MIRGALQLLTRILSAPRVLKSRTGVGEYLSRWYLKGKPVMPDGSEPFDPYGDMRKGAVYPKGIGVYLHQFLSSDVDDPHNHPFEWSVALVLAGGYVEERLNLDGTTTVRKVLPGMLNFIRSNDFHKVTLIEQDSWSLFIAGPRMQQWGFWDVAQGIYVPWRKYIDKKRGVYAVN